MHWFYQNPLPESGGQLTESKHLRSLRIGPGEEFCICDGEGGLLKARAVNSDPFEWVQIDRQRIPEPKVTFHLVQALAKNDRDEMAVQASIELGATQITPWQAERSIVRWDGKQQRNRERWQQIAIESLKQSQQGFMAKVNELSTTAGLAPKGVGIVLDPTAQLALDQLPSSDLYTLVIGPEGGISNRELELFEQKGFHRVRLGASVLRSSTAGPAAIAALQLLHGEFHS